MMKSIRKRTFCLEYKLPLNKRFVDLFVEMLEPLDTDSLPQDKVTIFGKSKPDVIVNRSKVGLIKDGSTVSGAVIMDDEYAKSKELKNSVAYL